MAEGREVLPPYTPIPDLILSLLKKYPLGSLHLQEPQTENQRGILSKIVAK